MVQRGKKSKSTSAVAQAAKAASKESKMKRKQSEPSTLLEREALATPAKRPRSGKDATRAIQKIVYDNLRSLTNEQLHSVCKGGVTCWERLTRDKALADVGQMCMGKNYYKHVRGLYTGMGEEDELQVLDPEEAVDEKLLDSITEIKKHNSNPAPLLAWLQRRERPNQKSAVGLMRAVRDIEPAVGKNHCEVVLAVLAWCYDIDFKSAYPTIFEAVRGVFDKALEKSWLIMKSPTIAAKIWWESVLPSASLDLGRRCMGQKCIYNNTKWQECKDELRVVVKTKCWPEDLRACMEGDCR